MSFDFISRKFGAAQKQGQALKAEAVTFGDLQGETCWRNGCQGVIEEHPPENCSCYISPPCGACTTPREYCDTCDWTAEEEDRAFYHNQVRHVSSSKQDAELGMYSRQPVIKFEERPLDPRKIDYHIRSHSNSSQRCVGMYPDGTTREQVEALVRGTFGGRFISFGGGKFEYLAYTD